MTYFLAFFGICAVLALLLILIAMFKTKRESNKPAQPDDRTKSANTE